VWTGHADGTILLHAEGKWGAAQYKTQVGGLIDVTVSTCLAQPWVSLFETFTGQ
jgi:hypothetical protein